MMELFRRLPQDCETSRSGLLWVARAISNETVIVLRSVADVVAVLVKTRLKELTDGF